MTDVEKRFAIFDMDGTLIDSMGYWTDLAEEYLVSKGVRDDFAGMQAILAPMTMEESGAYFMEKYALQGTPQQLAAEMNGLMDRHYKNDIPLKPGVREYLRELKSRGVRMCIASATPEHLARECLDRLQVLDCFEFILSCETLHTSKKKPDIYLAAARMLGAVPEEICVYEDVLYAVETAKNAGFYVAGVYDDAESARWGRICELADETVACPR